MPEPSAKMKRAIKLIESTLKLKYKGKTFDDAKKFLDENLPKLDGVDFRESKVPSEKQEKGIKLVNDMLGIEFTGTSMADASKFLEQYLDKAISKAQSIKKGKK